MRKILITGAAGFVGTNMTLALLREGHQVIGLDSLSRRGTELNLETLRKEFPNFDFRQKEIEDMAMEIYSEEPALVYHFAAQVAVTSSLASPERDFRINAEGSFRIAKAARDVGSALVYTSTNKVYGDNVNAVPLREFPTRWDFDGDLAGKGLPETFSIDASHHTPYGVSKLVGEMYVREFGGIANRCSCMYGPNQFGIVDQGWLSHIAMSKLLDKPVTIYGDGKQVRDALHVDDVVRLFTKQGELLLGDTRKSLAGEVFNVGGGVDNTISLLELCERWGIKPQFGPWRPADQKVFYCDVSKATRLLGWKPKVSLLEGLDDLYSWTEAMLGLEKA
ncbi:NAD-dependent epimerase/dehydratase family protein [Nibricoccus sp. IMCC34717]|uniref:NAD-dependent epimerase/dehydratase family protein n=1 Tax=Nibricoccus sp. IMCC34717 TaxID=3034021 RepID=UPI003850B473